MEDPVEVTVNVLDVNDNAPVFVQSSLHGNVSEAATIGSAFFITHFHCDLKPEKCNEQCAVFDVFI